jgi:hypothetical protein
VDVGRAAADLLRLLTSVVSKDSARGRLFPTRRLDSATPFLEEQMLRDHSQHNGRKVIDVAEAIVESHLLLLPPLQPHAVETEP